MSSVGKRCVYIILSVCLFLLSFISFCPTLSVVKAVGSSSNVMDDLTKDVDFTAEDFPELTVAKIEEMNGDLNLLNDQQMIEVIQIAESDEHNLYVYVYQPTDAELELTATSILMSDEFSFDGQDLDPHLYDLRLVSTSGVFDKYLVLDYTVSEETIRYYNLVTIYREFSFAIDELVHGALPDGAEIGVEVGQQWSASSENDTVVYNMATFETMEVDVVFPGSIRLDDGFEFFPSFGGNYDDYDVWFICFNIKDYIVEKIVDAKLSYKKRLTYNYVFNPYGQSQGVVPQEDWSNEIEVRLTSLETVSVEGDGLFAKKYKWNRILSSSDFVDKLEKQNVAISNEDKTLLQQSQWVFTFLETEYKLHDYSTQKYQEYTELSDVTVMTIHFLDILGRKYNLGVVSDRVHPDVIPDGSSTRFSCKDINWSFIFGLIGLIFLLWLLSITGILPLLIRGIAWIITAPFKFIKWLIDKFRGD